MATRTSTLDEMIADTLGRVNVVREAFGYQPLNELPDARPGDTRDCLYFRALKDIGCVSVGGTSLTFDSERKAQAVAALWNTEVEGRSVVSPRDVARTISAFDGDKTPHYNV